MRKLLAVCCLFITTLALGQDAAGRRYSVDIALGRYPQGTPKDALQSVLKAIDAGRIDYLMAHLADPAFVDAKVKEYRTFVKGGTEEGRELLAFRRLVRETADYFLQDPVTVKQLRQFSKGAEFAVMDGTAVGTLKEVPARKVFMKKVGERWFLENRQK